MESGAQLLPDRIDEEGVLLRRWLVSDAEALGRAVAESADHLRPWLAFMAEEPQTLEQRRAMLQKREHEWSQGGDVLLGIFVGGQVAGSCGLHRRRGPDALEIGFWIHPSFTRQGLATTVARLLTDAAFTVPGITHVEIHHDKANRVSANVPRRLGFRFVGEAPDAGNAPRAVGIDCSWRMDRDDWQPQAEGMYEREVRSIVSELRDRKPLSELLVGIDGPGGAGKSTLARELAARIDASIVQADDFYRPRRDRPAAAQIGETYDWRRLQKQVIEPLKSGRPARYQRYDWETDALGEWHDVPTGPLIIEGIYVLRTELRPCFDYTIWVEAPRDQRLHRGLARDGTEARQQWNEWMELEDEYVRSHRPDQHADRRVNGAGAQPNTSG